MALNKSRGNMYPWITHMHSHLRGQCPHGCSYCYVQAHERRYHSGAFVGPLRLNDKELNVRYGEDRTIFVEHQNDLFSSGVSAWMVKAILLHCRRYPCNEYVLQTKNPWRIANFKEFLPPILIIGTTIETNRDYPKIMGTAPLPEERADAMFRIKYPKFLTIEPVLDFDVDDMVALVATVGPKFVNIGADSKGHGLPEPPPEKLRALISRLTERGTEIRNKHNLGRLLDGRPWSQLPEVMNA
jgi:protein gp37